MRTHTRFLEVIRFGTTIRTENHKRILACCIRLDLQNLMDLDRFPSSWRQPQLLARMDIRMYSFDSQRAGK